MGGGRLGEEEGWIRKKVVGGGWIAGGEGRYAEIVGGGRLERRRKVEGQVK